jgi:hypothetical protein
MPPGPPAGAGGAAGFDGVPPVITSVDELYPRLLDVLLEDENPPDEEVEDTPDDIENAAAKPAVKRRIHAIAPEIFKILIIFIEDHLLDTNIKIFLCIGKCIMAGL